MRPRKIDDAERKREKSSEPRTENEQKAKRTKKRTQINKRAMETEKFIHV